jgi:undecaprenyl-diphosphatase
MDTLLSSTPDVRIVDDFDPSFPDVAGVVRRTALAYMVVTVSLIGIGGVGRLVIFDSSIGDAEADLLAWIADHRNGVLDQFATIGSTLTDTWTVIGVLVGAVTILIAIGQARCGGLMVIGIGLELGAFLVAGAVIDRSRPTVESLHSVPSTPSFPSGHVAASVVLYGSLVLVARLAAPPGRETRGLWIAPALVVLMVAASRMYEGVHYPTDVVGGAVLGAGALYGAVYAVGLLHREAR